MGELNNLMVLDNKIELTVTPRQSAVQIRAKLVPGGSALIEWIKTDCGCTNDPNFNEKYVNILYNDITDLGSASAKTFSKFVYVFMKDGNPKEIKNPKTGEETTNWGKTHERIELRITVKNKSIHD